MRSADLRIRQLFGFRRFPRQAQLACPSGTAGWRSAVHSRSEGRNHRTRISAQALFSTGRPPIVAPQYVFEGSWDRLWHPFLRLGDAGVSASGSNEVVSPGRAHRRAARLESSSPCQSGHVKSRRNRRRSMSGESLSFERPPRSFLVNLPWNHGHSWAAMPGGP
jgi:hypothetical protein